MAKITHHFDHHCYAVFSIVSVLCIVTKISGEEATPPHIEVLQRYGIPPNAESVAKYLRDLFPNEKQKDRMRQLVAQLGEDNYVRRESATKELLRMPVVSVALLEGAVESDDPEIRWRARLVLEQSDIQRAEVFHAVLRTIQLQELKGLADPLLAALPLCREEFLRATARLALKATVSPDDGDLLLRHLRSKDVHQRVAALAALSTVFAAGAVEHAEPLLKDDDDRVRVAAAGVLASRGDRKCLSVLVGLLEADEVRVRVDSIKTLRGLSGKRFGFTAYDDEQARAVSVVAWKQWVEGEGQSAKLNHPLKESVYDLGRILVCQYGQNKVIELDTSGKVQRERAVANHPWGCQGLPNGHRLVAAYSAKSVVEYDANWKEVWTQTGLPAGPMSVQRLENGNTLIACSDSQRIIEVDRANKTVWEVTIPGRPTDATRLENGNTLAALQNGNRVVEVDRAGKVVWDIKDIDKPIAAQRLENGNTLVSSAGTGGVKEFTRAGKEVWSKLGINHAYDVRRLANGNTLIAFNQGVAEYDRSGKEIWKLTLNGVSRLSRY